MDLYLTEKDTGWRLSWCLLPDKVKAKSTSNFISYDRGIIQKQIQDAFGIGFKELTDKLFGYIIKDVQQNNCATAN